MDTTKKAGHKAPTSAGNGKAAATPAPAAASSKKRTKPVATAKKAAPARKAEPVISDAIVEASTCVCPAPAKVASVEDADYSPPRRRRRRAEPKEEGISTPVLIGGGLLLAYFLFGGNSSGNIAGSESPAEPLPEPEADLEEVTAEGSAEIAGYRHNRFIEKQYGPGPLRGGRAWME